MLVGWDFPLSGWLKVNLGGVVKENPNMVVIGAIARDLVVVLVAGCVMSLRQCSLVKVEVWGALNALNLA